MMILESPILGEPKEKWIAWLAELRAMDPLDVSVKFAIKTAETSIRAMEDAGL